MRFSSQRNAQHHVIVISDLLVPVNGLWMWIFAAFGHLLFEHIFLLQRWFKSQRSAAQTEGEQLPCLSKGGSNQNGKLQGGTSKRRTNKLNSKEANHIQCFFFKSASLNIRIFCLGFQHYNYHPYAVLRCDALEKEVTLSCTRYWPLAPFFSVGGCPPMTPVFSSAILRYCTLWLFNIAMENHHF